MTNFQELILDSMIKPLATVKRLCQPLADYLRIVNFCYLRIYEDGRVVHLTNCMNLCDFFYEDKCYVSHPYFRKPSLFEAGVTLIPLAVDDCLRKKSQDLFKTDQMCMILKKCEDFAEVSIFAPENLAQQDCNILMNRLHLLDKFATYFRREAQTLINDSLEVCANVKNDIKELFDATDPGIPLYRNDLKEQAFLKTILPLTPREKACLQLFKTGHSAQATGAKLKISQRTVEHHFENIKMKLGCHSKWDLLEI